jgi:hypothetical protein
MGSKPQSVSFTKSSTFLSNVSPCIVSMNNEFSPVVLWLELSQYCNDIIMIVLGVKGRPSGSATIKGNPDGFHAMVTMIFRSWPVCLALSGGISPGPSTATSSLKMAWAESRFIARNKQIDR